MNSNAKAGREAETTKDVGGKKQLSNRDISPPLRTEKSFLPSPLRQASANETVEAGRGSLTGLKYVQYPPVRWPNASSRLP